VDVERTMSIPLFRATPIFVLCAPRSMPTTLMVAVVEARSGGERDAQNSDGKSSVVMLQAIEGLEAAE
jgi:hypothetical protein